MRSTDSRSGQTALAVKDDRQAKPYPDAELRHDPLPTYRSDHD
jgi:hypothetical protein